jgi:hypothetical protein
VDGAAIEPLSSWWQALVARQGPGPALARMCIELALRSDRVTAAYLATTALDLTPGSGEALALLERTIAAPNRRLLWPRYEAFLASEAPVADVPRVREHLIALLFELGHAYSALAQVDETLDALMAADLDDDRVRRAYDTLLAEHEPFERLDELACPSCPCEPPLLAEAAE